MSLWEQILEALSMAFGMFWEILWALVIGFAISAAVQAVISKSEMARLLPDDSFRSCAKATGLGAASSSCSYAAVAIARSIFRKGGDFTAAMAFEFASTNLVFELGIILVVLMGWEFAAAEFVGGPLMIIALVFLFRAFLKKRLVDEARDQAERGEAGKMEGHAEMDMSVEEGSIRQRIMSSKGFTSISHYFVMDWASIWKDIFPGLLIAGALAAWVPNSFWESFFLTDHPLLAKIWGPLMGPVVELEVRRGGGSKNVYDAISHNPLVADSSPAGPTKQMCRSGAAFVASENFISSANSSDYQQNASELFAAGF